MWKYLIDAITVTVNVFAVTLLVGLIILLEAWPIVLIFGVVIYWMFTN